MASRFYLPSTGSTTLTPGYSASWTGSGTADRLPMVTSRINSAMTSKTVNALAGATAEFVLARQYISDPISAQTISGTVKGQVRALESATGLNATLAVLIKVVSNNGATERGTLLAISASDATTTPPEFAATLTNRQIMNASEATSLSLSSVSAQEGDRIVIEIGIREVSSTTSQSASLNFGDNSGTDLAENQTTTTSNNPWIEFSQDIAFSGTRGSGFPIDRTNPITRGLRFFAPLIERGGSVVTDSANRFSGKVMGSYSWVSNKYGSAFRADGSSAYITFGDPSKNLIPQGPFSAFVVVKSTNTGLAYRSIFSIGNGRTGGSTDLFNFATYATSGNYQVSGYFGATSVEISLGTHDTLTHSLACTWDGTVFRAYHDGELLSQNTPASGKIYPTTVPVLIGAGATPSNSITEYFQGDISFASVWNRTLTGREIGDLNANVKQLIQGSNFIRNLSIPISSATQNTTNFFQFF